MSTSAGYQASVRELLHTDFKLLAYMSLDDAVVRRPTSNKQFP